MQSWNTTWMKRYEHCILLHLTAVIWELYHLSHSSMHMHYAKMFEPYHNIFYHLSLGSY